MKIRKYVKSDEKEWLKCRLLSFYDSSYYDNIVHQKDEYGSNDINLVATDNDMIIGFIDIEIEKKQKEICNHEGELGGMIWDLGVLPEYRNKKIATLLLEKAIKIAKCRNIFRFEAWTQDDVPANKWYKNQNFKYIKGYLNVFGGARLVADDVGEILGVRSVNFEAALERKSELIEKFDRIHEVRLYELIFNEFDL